MNKPQLDIQLGPDGKLVVKVSGVSGEECTKLADMVKEIVGIEDSRTLTDEHYGGVRILSESKEQTQVKASRFSGL